VRLINEGWFRVGNERYAKTYKTFGITTLRKGHVKVRGSRI
jgi:DNA topoisomerase-1